MDWIMIGGGLLGAWMLLVVLSSERRRRMEELEKVALELARRVADETHELR